MDDDLKGLLNRQIAELGARIEQSIVSVNELASTAEILRSVPGIGPVASTMLIAGMPELGYLSGEQAAALTGLAPIVHDSGALRGKRPLAPDAGYCATFCSRSPLSQATTIRPSNTSRIASEQLLNHTRSSSPQSQESSSQSRMRCAKHVKSGPICPPHTYSF
ncbi:MAG: transposase [Sedimentitalea sp.]|uniref:transposase n=1 Tax=Sedimentitalea sp. TaxID=2048915 RepID=UPI003267761A